MWIAKKKKIECKYISIQGLCVEQKWRFQCSSNVSYIKREAGGEICGQ